MSLTITLPKAAVGEDDLPRVCVATGATEGVEYHDVEFTFIPMWARLSVALCGIIGVVLMLINMKKVKAQIPFTADAHVRFKRSRWIPLVVIFGGIGLGILPLLIDPDLAILGGIVFLACLMGGIVYAQVVGRAAGPWVKEITDEVITLEIPNDVAAAAISERLLARG